jgi:hypothetical protein
LLRRLAAIRQSSGSYWKVERSQTGIRCKRLRSGTTLKPCDSCWWLVLLSMLEMAARRC